MNRLRRRRLQQEDDVELDMVPIMNMFLVLIPFLLMSASFLDLKAINTSVPVLSSAENINDETPKEKKIKLTLVVEIKDSGLYLSATSDNAPQEIVDKVDRVIEKERMGAYPMETFGKYLKALKADYPASDTIIIIPDKSVVYETIIKTMDMARNTEDSPLFPNVVLSGKVG